MATPHRIVVADTTSLVPNIVRAAVDLVERDAVVIEARSGAAALAELERGGVHLLVSAFVLADMRGFELALKASQLKTGAEVIILAGAADPEMDEATRADSPFHYLVRAEQGEQFVRLLRAALDGQPLTSISEDSSGPVLGPDLGPVPPVDFDQFSSELNEVLTEAAAMAIVVIDRQGRILQEVGAVGYMDREELAQVLAPTLTHMASIGTLVGGDKPRSINFYDGQELDIFTLSIGLHHFMCIVFEGASGVRAFGAVTHYGRRAVAKIVSAFEEAAFTIAAPQPAAEAPAAEAKGKGKGKGKKRATQEAPPVKAEAEAPPEYEPPPAKKLDPLPEDADLEAVLAGLDNLDLSQADDLFDPEKLAALAAEALAGERLTYEEAQQMGVLQR